MKYKILKSFRGSQGGRVTRQFTEGEEVELTDYLADIVVPDGWARPIETIDVDNKAIVTDGKRRGRPRK